MRLIDCGNARTSLLHELWGSMWKESTFKPFKNLEEFMDQVYNDNIWKFLLVDDHIAGFVMVRGWVEEWEEKVLGVYIVPEHRGKGFGTILCLVAMQDARESGAQSIRLHVHPNNDLAISLYDKLGFTRSDEMHNGEYVMRRFI